MLSLAWRWTRPGPTTVRGFRFACSDEYVMLGVRSIESPFETGILLEISVRGCCPLTLSRKTRRERKEKREINHGKEEGDPALFVPFSRHIFRESRGSRGIDSSRLESSRVESSYVECGLLVRRDFSPDFSGEKWWTPSAASLVAAPFR